LDFFIFWNNQSLYNIYFSSVLLYFRSLTFIDNGFFYHKELNKKEYRELILNKLNYDIEKLFMLEKRILFELSTIDPIIQSLYVEKVKITELKNNRDPFTSEENVNFVTNLVTVKILKVSILSSIDLSIHSV